jgi:bifunctional non-homologous end joining protein LigD
MAQRTATKKNEQKLKIGNRTVSVTNLDKVLYPGNGSTKGQVIDYYIRVAPYLLPHLKNRPVTLKRYPNGVGGEFFYEKDAPGFTPEWVKTFPVPRRKGGPDIRYVLINDLATLVWSANLANLEIHPFLHRVPAINNPTAIVFDLDPGEGATVLECANVAFLLKDVLEHLELRSFAKVSGSKGLQVYIPLNTKVTYEVTQPFARTLAELLERQNPKLVISEMAKSARRDKVFIDWSQNADFKTTVGVYSLRAKRNTPFVSLPVTWDELRAALDAHESSTLYWNPETTLERLESVGDLFAEVQTLKQKLPAKFVEQLEAFAPAAVVPDATQPKTLEKYRAKRNFNRTSEPAPAPVRRSAQGSRRRFVIQKHAASHLHYDFRLEMHDVLKSWAVPKGVPYAAGEKRLAMSTEDHPLDYLEFEGTIPQGQYGGGTVMVWDIGTYEVMEGNYYKGSLRIFLQGRKLKGEWVLTKNREKSGNAWFLTKAPPAMKPISPKKDDSSALTGRSMELIAADRDAVWHSNRAAAPAAGTGTAREVDTSKLPATTARFIEPMRAKLTDALPEGDAWDYEIKLDGYRALLIHGKDGVRLLSRNNRTLADRFSQVVKAGARLAAETVLDGEIVALDEQGRPSFNILQNRRTTTQPIVYYVFDILVYQGKDLLGLPLSDRRILLNDAAAGLGNSIRVLGAIKGTPDELIHAAQEQELEGFVAKRQNSVYEPGQRSGAWLKFKVNRGQELVIGGYKPGKNGFDNLAAGYYDGDKLMFIAKVKNGFVPDVKAEILSRLKPLETKTCPFANLPEPKNARRGEALTPEAMKKYRWLRPELVAQVDFTDWTDANHLRHSRFVALRDDKDPKEVVREQ